MSIVVGAAFDLEGTSVNLEQQHHDAHLLAAASFGITLDYESALAQLPHFIGGPDEKVAEDIFDLRSASFGMNREEFCKEFLERDRELYQRMFRESSVQPREGLSDFLHWLDRLRVPTAIGSLTTQEQALVILERSGLLARFAGRAIFKENVKQVKPAPDVFLATAKLMGVAPEHQLVFEDSPRGIQAAHSAKSLPIGMPVVNDPAARSALEAVKPLAIFNDWRDAELRQFVFALFEELRSGAKLNEIKV